MFFRAVLLLLFAIACCGCTGRDQPDFEALHPVQGKIQRAGMPLSGGALRFTPIPDKPDFVVNSVVDEKGEFTLTTVRTTDSQGERRQGAPAGEYTVVYMPESQDQTVDFQPPITLPKKVVIEAKTNNLTLEVPPR